MTFSEQLNRYLEDLKCPASRLAKLAEIPPYTISKYRSGSRLPEKGSDTVIRLAGAIRTVAEENGIKSIMGSDVKAALDDAIQFETESFDFDILIKHLRLIVKGFGVTLTEIAEGTNFSRSTLYSMWRGKSKLRDPDIFVKLLAQYIVNRFGDMNGQMKASKLIGWPEQLFDTKSNYLEAMTSWLSGEFVSSQGLSEKDLQIIETFDLNDYQRDNKFEPVTLSKMPINLGKIKEYFGMKGMEAAIADFIRATSVSRSYKDIILYSDFPIKHLLLESTMPKLWVEGLGLALQKGVGVKSIHSMERPIEEVMESMNMLIPMFMSGQIKPMYVEHQSSIFHNCIIASGGAVLCGFCIEGAYDDAYFQLFTGADAIEREYRVAEHLVSMAKPLMEVYTPAEKDKYEKIIQSDAKTPGRRDAILSSPPIYTISDELLSDIFERNRVNAADAKRIKAYIRKEKKRVQGICAKNEVRVRLTYFMQHEFKSYPVRLDLARGLLGVGLVYTFEEYKQHIDETKAFAAGNANYSFAIDSNAGFRNIQITTIENSTALISKTKLPEMNIILRHPRGVRAMAKTVDGKLSPKAQK